MRVQVVHPAEHTAIADLPFREPLDTWSMPNIHRVLGLHRHVVKLVEFEGVSYVVKELPDELARREYRLLREIAEEGLPTVEMVAVVTDRDDADGMIVTRHLDYSLPYRSLLMGRGLEIPYLGDRVLDALVVLLVRIHLAGFFWGDCSLSNTLFRRDAGALQAYIIDVETAERHGTLTDGQREFDLMIATDNVAGGLLDLQAARRLADDIDPIDVALAIGDRYHALWNEITATATAPIGDVMPMRRRLDRLHDLGFAVEELEVVTNADDVTVNFIPKVVEHGYHAEQLAGLTGLQAGDNQARRMLQDIKSYRAWLQSQSDRPVPLNVAAVRWLDRVFEPVMAAIPPELLNRLEAAEIFHQLLEHRWYMTEKTGENVQLLDVLEDYLQLLEAAPEEQILLDDLLADESVDRTGELLVIPPNATIEASAQDRGEDDDLARGDAPERGDGDQDRGEDGMDGERSGAVDRTAQ
jgi:tRNA A-37 threonylcarbamoyl transferase component Bud32